MNVRGGESIRESIMMSRTAEHINVALEISTCLLLMGTLAVLRLKYRRGKCAALEYSKAHEHQLHQKDLLIREVHHRVANQMGLTAALLHLQASRSAHPDTKAFLFESENRLRTLSKLHERLHQPNTHSRTLLYPYLSELAGDLVTTLRPDLEYCAELTGDGPVTTSSTAVTCGLLVHELIANCIKHAFPLHRGGTIRISLKRPPPNRLRISIHDNGTGLPPEFSLQNPTTSGMAIVSALAKDLGGSFSATHLNPGTEFTVEFPVLDISKPHKDDPHA